MNEAEATDLTAEAIQELVERERQQRARTCKQMVSDALKQCRCVIVPVVIVRGTELQAGFEIVAQ